MASSQQPFPRPPSAAPLSQDASSSQSASSSAYRSELRESADFTEESNGSGTSISSSLSLLTTTELALLVGEEYTKAAIYPGGTYLVSVVSSPVETLQYGTDPPSPSTKQERHQTPTEEFLLDDIVPMDEDEPKQKETERQEDGEVGDDEDKSTVLFYEDDVDKDAEEKSIIDHAEDGETSKQGNVSKTQITVRATGRAQQQEQQQQQRHDRVSRISGRASVDDEHHHLPSPSPHHHHPSSPKPSEPHVEHQEQQPERHQGHRATLGTGSQLTPVTPQPFSVLRCFTNPADAVCLSKSKGFAVCQLTFGSVEIFPYKEQTPVLGSPLNELPGSSLKVSSANEEPPMPGDDEQHDVTARRFDDTGNSLLLFVVASQNDRAVYRTRTIVPSQQQASWTWNETIELQIHSPKSSISFELYDKEFHVEDGEPFEDELLAGVSVQIEDLRYYECYTTSIDVNVSPLPTIPLKSAVRKIKQALELQKEESETTKVEEKGQGKTKRSPESVRKGEEDSVMLSTHLEQRQVTHPLCIHVQIHLVLIPSKTSFLFPASYLATFGALGLSNDPIEVTPDMLSVASTTINVDKLRQLLYRVKYIFWDSCFLTLHNRWTSIQSWDSMSESATLLGAVWVNFYYPELRLPCFLVLISFLLLWLPGILPPISDTPNGKAGDDKQQQRRRHRRGIGADPQGDDLQHPQQCETQQQKYQLKHYPSAAQPFLQGLLTDDLLLRVKRIEPKLERLASTVERLYRFVRDDETSKTRESIALAFGFCCAFAVGKPKVATQLFRVSLQILVLVFFFATWSPVQFMMRVVVALYRSLRMCLKYSRQSRKAISNSGLSLRTFR